MQMPPVLYICDTINVKPRDNPDVIMLNCVSKGGRRTGGGREAAIHLIAAAGKRRGDDFCVTRE